MLYYQHKFLLYVETICTTIDRTPRNYGLKLVISFHTPTYKDRPANYLYSVYVHIQIHTNAHKSTE